MEALKNFMDRLTAGIDYIDGYAGGIILVVLLVGVGLFFTFTLGFVQFRNFGRAFKLMFGGIFGKKEGKSGLSSFQALATAVAAQVGTGNVGGVATAISIGGPGAVFWMWITALLGMSTIFAEAVLAQLFREKRDGELVGGPAYYIEKGLKDKAPKLGRFLAVFFSIAIVLALGLAGNMVQANSIANGLHSAFSIPLWLIGLVLAVICALIFIGGVKRIGRIAEMVVPFMAVIYVVASIILLVRFYDHIIPALKLIFEGAFAPQAAAGGFGGAVVAKTIRMGVQRGLFSNEAGMGSTPHAHAIARVKHPAEQGLMAFCGVFIDTIVICSATALAIILTEAYKIPEIKGVQISMAAFEKAFPAVGDKFLAISLMFFAFTTIIGWYYFGEANIRYLFGAKALTVYRVLVVIAVFGGTLAKVEFVWTLNGFLNNLMVYPNVLALFILSPLVWKVYKDYRGCLKSCKIEYDYPPEARAD